MSEKSGSCLPPQQVRQRVSRPQHLEETSQSVSQLTEAELSSTTEPAFYEDSDPPPLYECIDEAPPVIYPGYAPYTLLQNDVQDSNWNNFYAALIAKIATAISNTNTGDKTVVMPPYPPRRSIQRDYRPTVWKKYRRSVIKAIEAAEADPLHRFTFPSFPAQDSPKNNLHRVAWAAYYNAVSDAITAAKLDPRHPPVFMPRFPEELGFLNELQTAYQEIREAKLRWMSQKDRMQCRVSMWLGLDDVFLHFPRYEPYGYEKGEDEEEEQPGQGQRIIRRRRTA